MSKRFFLMIGLGVLVLIIVVLLFLLVSSVDSIVKAAIESYGSDELAIATARARELCEQVGDAAQLLPLLYREMLFAMVRRNFRVALGMAEEFVSKAEGQGAAGPALVAHRCVGLIQWIRGELSESRAEFQYPDARQWAAVAVCHGLNSACDRGLPPGPL